MASRKPTAKEVYKELTGAYRWPCTETKRHALRELKIALWPSKPEDFLPYVRNAFSLIGNEPDSKGKERLLALLESGMMHFLEKHTDQDLSGVMARFYEAVDDYACQPIKSKIIALGLKIAFLEQKPSSDDFFDYAIDYYKRVYEGGRWSDNLLKAQEAMFKLACKHCQLVTDAYLGMCYLFSQANSLSYPTYPGPLSPPHEHKHYSNIKKRNEDISALRDKARTYGEMARQRREHQTKMKRLPYEPVWRGWGGLLSPASPNDPV